MLRNKVAVITGGTRGIGYATARTFLQNGAAVVIFGSREESVKKAITRLKEETGNMKTATIHGMWPDLTDFSELEKAFTRIKDELEHIDILVNNAGISTKTSLYDYTAEDFYKIMALNVNAVFHGVKAVAPIMKAQGYGVILNTSSVVSLYGQATGAGYPASKFAVNGLTKSLARELGSDGIRVNAVAPGIINTDMFQSLPEELQRQVTTAVPLKRLGKPQDIANAFLFLASDLASYVTGEILSVDGAVVL